MSADSTCYGTTANGRLENGVQLPRSGPNFVTYSDVARAMGRAYVHSGQSCPGFGMMSTITWTL